MKKIIRINIFLLLLCFFAGSQLLIAQKLSTKGWRKSEIDSLEHANLFFEDAHNHDDAKFYHLALPIYLGLLKNHPNEIYLKYTVGVCGLYRGDTHKKSYEFLKEVYEKNKKIPEIELDLAKACHLNYKFDESIQFANLFQSKNKNVKPKKKHEIEKLIAYCNNAKILVANPLPAKIEPIVGAVNTEASEYVPVVSSDESFMIFTLVGDQCMGGRQNAYNESDPYGIFYEDVFYSRFENGEWQIPKSMGSNINTVSHDAAVAMSGDGQVLFTYKDDGTNGGDLFISYLQGTEWSIPERIRGDVNSTAWEGSCSMSADRKLLYYSSDRAGGFGGRDLYVAFLQPDGTYSNSRNLGKVINTEDNEDAPFIHPDGRTLIYSSEGMNSMGSYDIFKSVLSLVDSAWSKPENLGYPINSPDDERYYILSADGKHGYYASGKEEGKGLEDIYLVTPGLTGMQTFVAMVKGRVTENGKPVEADIIIEVRGKNKVFGNFKSNSETGKYLIDLPSGEDYKIIFKYKNYPFRELPIDVTKHNSFFEIDYDLDFGLPTDTTKSNTQIANTNPEKPVETKPAKTSAEGLLFNVQVAAYKFHQNYKYDHIKHLGKVYSKVLDDGVTRFVIGPDFNSLEEANDFCKKVRAAGQQDAFVLAIYNGHRTYLEELENKGIIPKLPR